MKTIITFAFLVFITVFTTQSVAQDEWRHGIGTGLFALNLDGDLGMHTNAFGPVQVEMDLDTSDISDYVKTAYGFGGFSAKGEWKFLYSLQYMELGDDVKGVTDPGGIAVKADATFTASGAEVAAVYNFAKTGKSAWGALGGIRYMKHEFESDVTIGASTFSRNFEHEWTDVIIGLTHDYLISKTMAWNTQIDAGFGESEGTASIKTGASWRLGDSWVTSFYGKYMANHLENGNKGDEDWYLYDVDEFGVGLGVVYLY
jgi:hypothetical protein